MIDWAEQGTHFDILRRRAAASGEKPFIVFGERTLTFAGLERESGRVAAGLQKLGVTKGSRVALMTGNRLEFLYIWFALARLGAVLVPVNTAHRGEVLRHMLAISECTLMLAESGLLDQVAPELPALPKLRTIVVLDDEAATIAGIEAVPYGALPDQTGAPDPTALSPSDPAMIMFTSGTTGPSKGALKPQNEAYYLASMACRVMSYTERDCIYICLPLFHGNAQLLGVLPALRAGARVVLVPKFSASGFWPDVRRHGCTAANYVGSLIPMLMKAEPRTDDADNPLEKMMGAGAPAALYEAFETRFGVNLTEGYGMSEAGAPFQNIPGNRKTGTCGRLQADYDVMLVDDAGLPVPDGTVGELLMRPRKLHIMMLEYVGMPDKTIEAWRDLWFHTGDYLRRDADGFYSFVDRKKDAIRRRGENISSYEVEQSVGRHDDVLQVAAIGVPSEVGEEDVMVCVVPKPGRIIDPAALHAFCRSQMAPFMVPRHIRVMDALPMTATQRVEKFRLRKAGTTADTWTTS